MAKNTATEPTEAASEAENESQDQDLLQESVTEDKKPKTSQKKKWISIAVVGLIVLTVAGLLIWRSRRMGYTKQFVIEHWHTLASQSDDLAGITAGTPALSKSSDLAKQIRTIDSAVKDQKVSLALIPSFLNDRHSLNVYSSFTQQMGAYTTKLASLTDDPTTVTTEDIAATKELAKTAKESSSSTKESLSYLTENINGALFTAPDYIEGLKKQADEAKASAAAAKSAATQAAQLDTLNNQLVQSATTSFMDGFISGDAAKMKRYMTDAFSAEYDFSQLSAAQREYTYPASYRLVSTTKKDANYEVTVNVLNKYKNAQAGNPDQYTLTTTYTLTYNANTGRWLINLQKNS